MKNRKEFNRSSNHGIKQQTDELTVSHRNRHKDRNKDRNIAEIRTKTVTEIGTETGVETEAISDRDNKMAPDGDI